MKEKLRLKERVVMSRDSRPGVHNMNKLSSIFTVTEVLSFEPRNKTQ